MSAGKRLKAVFSQMRVAQLHEARAVIELAWNDGYFDSLDPTVMEKRTEYSQTGRVVRVLEIEAAPPEYLQRRVAQRAEELLCGQFPEVKVKSVPQARMWAFSDRGLPDRPRSRIICQLRSPARQGLRAKVSP